MCHVSCITRHISPVTNTGTAGWFAMTKKKPFSAMQFQTIVEQKLQNLRQLSFYHFPLKILFSSFFCPRTCTHQSYMTFKKQMHIGTTFCHGHRNLLTELALGAHSVKTILNIFSKILHYFVKFKSFYHLTCSNEYHRWLSDAIKEPNQKYFETAQLTLYNQFNPSL